MKFDVDCVNVLMFVGVIFFTGSFDTNFKLRRPKKRRFWFDHFISTAECEVADLKVKSSFESYLHQIERKAN